MKEHSPWEVEHRGSTLPRCPLIQQCQNQNIRSRGSPGHPDRIHTKRLLTVVQAVWYKIRQAIYRGVGSRGARYRSTRDSTRGSADDAGEPGVLDGRHKEHDCQLHEEQRGIGARWHGGTEGSVAVEESPPGAGPARDAGMGSISRGEHSIQEHWDGQVLLQSRLALREISQTTHGLEGGVNTPAMSRWWFRLSLLHAIKHSALRQSSGLKEDFTPRTGDARYYSHNRLLESFRVEHSTATFPWRN